MIKIPGPGIRRLKIRHKLKLLFSSSKLSHFTAATMEHLRLNGRKKRKKNNKLILIHNIKIDGGNLERYIFIIKTTSNIIKILFYSDEKYTISINCK
jgi:hypothetical protein